MTMTMTMTIAAATTTTTTTTSFIGKKRSEQNTRVAGKYLKNIRETSLFFFSYRSRPDLCYMRLLYYGRAPFVRLSAFSKLK
jgi:hypothetical protein